jgi:hypothetical protein
MLKITGTMMLVLMLTALTASAAWVPLVPINADQSSMQASYLNADTTINGNGLRYGDLHNNRMGYDLQNLAVDGTMWLSEFGEEDHWISFDFGAMVTIEEITVWNFNDISQLSAGIHDFYILYTQDAASVPLADRSWEKAGTETQFETLNDGTGSNFYTPNTTLSAAMVGLEGVVLTGLKLEVINTYGSSQAGLSEIHFEGTEVPEPATMGLLAVGGIAMLRSRRRRNNK